MVMGQRTQQFFPIILPMISLSQPQENPGKFLVATNQLILNVCEMQSFLDNQHCFNRTRAGDLATPGRGLCQTSSVTHHNELQINGKTESAEYQLF